MKHQKGTLYLIPSSLGNPDISLDISERQSRLIRQLSEYVVEEIRTVRRYLRKAGLTAELDTIKFHVLNEHSQPEDIRPIIQSLLGGHNVGMLSEAGMPCVADPGHMLVRAAHTHHIRVVPLPGPSSLILALMASGFNGQNFAFAGYLPVRSSERIHQIRKLEKAVYQLDQTQIIIETPYRNLKLFNDLLLACSDETSLCIACDLTLDTEWIRTQPIKEWKRVTPDIHKHPAVFLLYR